MCQPDTSQDIHFRHQQQASGLNIAYQQWVIFRQMVPPDLFVNHNAYTCSSPCLGRTSKCWWWHNMPWWVGRHTIAWALILFVFFFSSGCHKTASFPSRGNWSWCRPYGCEVFGRKQILVLFTTQAQRSEQTWKICKNWRQSKCGENVGKILVEANMKMAKG